MCTIKNNYLHGSQIASSLKVQLFLLYSCVVSLKDKNIIMPHNHRVCTVLKTFGNPILQLKCIEDRIWR